MDVADLQRARQRAVQQPRMAWETHPGWAEYNARHVEQPLRMPPPRRTRDEIRRLIVGRSG